MSEREHYCPFLNRADPRCSAFFSIERLQHAFEHCFDAYKACNVYQELLVERQARRSEAAAVAAGGARPHGPGRLLWTTACTSPQPDAKTRFVQIHLPHLTTHGTNATAGAGADGYPMPAG